MDGLANLGRAFSTPQFVLSVIVGLAMIGGGIYLLTGYRPSSGIKTIPNPISGLPPIQVPDFSPWKKTAATVGGAFLIISGVGSIGSAWIKRRLIRASPEAAALFGAVDAVRIAKGVL